MAAEEKWYFTKDQLGNTPSRKHGFDADRELSSRQQAANLIQDMGQKLQVTQLCINTAIVYMHRFYMFHSFTRFHRNSMAAAALFLAAKVEEQPRKLEHVIKVSQICLHREHMPVDVRSEAYIEQAQELVVNENILLQTLGFDVAIDHPHTHVVRCCHLVRASKELAQTSYFMASNSLHLTTMCLQYKPTEVACFCIHLACKWSNWEIPQSTEGKPWFWYVDKSVTQELLEQLTDEFLVMFEKCPSRLKKKIMSLSSTQNSTILSAFGNDGDNKKRNGEGASGPAIFPSSEEIKKKQEYQRHHPDYKKHHSIPHHSRPDSHGMQSKSSCMFGPPQRTQPPGHSSSSSSSGGGGGSNSSQSRSMPVKPNPPQDPGIGKRDHLHHRPRRPEEKHPTRNHEQIPPYKKFEKVSSAGLSDFSTSSANSSSSNSARGVGTSGYMLNPSHTQLQPHPPQLPPVLHPVVDVKPDISSIPVNKIQAHSHQVAQSIPKPKTPPAPPPVKVERSIFSPEKSTPPTDIRAKIPSPSLPGGTSRKRSISREPELAIYVKTEDVKPPLVPEQIKPEPKEEKQPVVEIPKTEFLLPIDPVQQATSTPEDVHKDIKKKKKKHKEHKEKHKDKHKHKHKNREVLKADPIVITIPKEKLTLHQPLEKGLKIKIPKDRIATSIPPPTGLKIKISKDKIKESKKRDRSEERNAGLPTKYHRPNGTTLQVTKTLDLVECSPKFTENETLNLSLTTSPPLALNDLPLSIEDVIGPKTPPGMSDALMEIIESNKAETSLKPKNNNNYNKNNNYPENYQQNKYHYRNNNYRPEQNVYTKNNNYRGRGRGRYIRVRPCFNMGTRPPPHNYPPNFIPPQMNIPPPTHGYNPLMMHHPPIMPYYPSQVLVPNFPPPPPLPDEPPPQIPPPPPPN